MKEFVVQNANVLKKFRSTGTASTMKMLAQVFKGDPKVVYGYVRSLLVIVLRFNTLGMILTQMPFFFSLSNAMQPYLHVRAPWR